MVDARSLSLRQLRRNLHKHPEAGWKEFRTTCMIAKELDERNFTTHLGSEAVKENARLGVPADDEIEEAIDRALDEGAPRRYLEQMDGVTGLVAEKTYGSGVGPTIGVRVDLDALERQEASCDHRPAREGFASVHPTEMHACGHDGHTAIGIGVAREIDEHGGFDGKLKLFFQPAEEGGRGGKAMSETQHLDGVDYLLALHVGLGNETGTVISAFENPLSNAKIDVTFKGEPSHAGNAPNEGRNALHAATTAIQNLYGIPRHSDGATRINIGRVNSPNPQNVIAEEAQMRVEVRGGTATLNEYMLGRARRMVEHAAAMHDVTVETSLYGKTTTFSADPELIAAVTEAATGLDSVTNVHERRDLGGSEDASYLIRRVQENGGKATYVGVGASNPHGHHTARFDFDERAIDIGVSVITKTVRSL